LPQDSIRPARLAEAIATHFEGLILEGSLRPGDRLMAERDLARKLDVSRPSLREALDLLEQRGMLESGRNGAVIAPILGDGFAIDLKAMSAASPECGYDYMEFRGLVEGQATYLAALRGTGIDREIIGNRFQAMLASHDQAGTPDDEAEADAAFHLAIYEASHNVMLLHIMGSLASMLRDNVFYHRSKLYDRKGARELLLEQHRAICSAILAGDPEAARAAAEGHVTFTRAAIEEIDAAEARLEITLRRFADDPAETHHEFPA